MMRNTLTHFVIEGLRSRNIIQRPRDTSENFFRVPALARAGTAKNKCQVSRHVSLFQTDLVLSAQKPAIEFR